MDLYDHPEKVKLYLQKVNRSIDDYYRLLCRIFDMPVMDPNQYHFGDDVASLISPADWPDFVLPAWRLMYECRTSGLRKIHVENLCESHLHFLEEMGISYYDPGLSRQLTPQTIYQGCRVPFGWSLQGYELPRMTDDMIRNFVIAATRDGASRVCLDLEWGMANDESLKKVLVFKESVRQVKEKMDQGIFGHGL